ncbi:ankyrin repeat and EF-hand domain-containing protein 1-like isoform X2 [Myxocyprinus asiaticus]|uniref:ankyrin repeat and EF-hand domain-containing protein 1-like isoform X2 n=1 Tax=Myxocyprinus asiaticus TaxID=70543 RepID=UPI002222E794|nr:ankyrin repeat and EF-hand domain-containing protein 1-like isoform X2 [Myxocyprinus asiaticus]
MPPDKIKSSRIFMERCNLNICRYMMMSCTVAKGRLEVLQIYRLLQCVRAGDKPYIEKLISMGVDDLINITEPREGNGVLHLASVANDSDMLEFLIVQGARPDVQDRRGRTPLMMAAELGHDRIVSLLAKKNADMKLFDKEGKGLLFYCIQPTKRHMRCLQVALNGNADVNNVSAKGMPVFLLACEQAQDCEGMCLSILEKGADPSATNQATGRTALMEATRAGAINLVRAILRKGGNVNALDKKQFHAAHFAAEGGFFEFGSYQIIKVLSAYAADFGVVTSEGDTPLHFAAYGGYTDCCRFLAQRGCNPKLKNQEGLLPRQIAKDCGHKATVKELKKAERLPGKFSKGMGGTSEPWALTLHDWSHENETALRSAFESASDSLMDIETVSRETFVSVLQELQAPIDEDQIQALLLALDRRREGINITDFLRGLKYLPKTYVMASYGPKKKKESKGGKTKKNKFSLLMPICTVPPDLIQRRDDGGPPHFMIESYQHATDTHRFDRDHRPEHPIKDDTAWYIDEPEKIYININYCVKTGDIESLKLALNQKVPVDVKDCFYKTPLMAACASGNYEVAKILLDNGADVNACDQFSWTPLHHACHAGQLDVIQLLLEAGASVDPPTLSGATPLMRAIESCRPSCVEYLIRAGAKVNAVNKTEQNCLDVAHAYADFRVVDLIKAKIDAQPKHKDSKKAQPVKVQRKPTPASTTGSTKEKGTVLTPPASSNSAVKKAMKKDSVVVHSTQITSGKLNKLDISFVPRTTWQNQLTTSQLTERKVSRRQRFTYEVDFDDFRMPFNKNIQKKSVELELTE